MKSIEGLTIEELKALEKALAYTIVRHENDDPMFNTWISLMTDVSQQLNDQEFEQERKDNLPIEP